jgi:hypothetical protein
LDHFTLLYVFLRSVVFVSVCLLIMCVCFVMTAKVVLGINGENPVSQSFSDKTLQIGLSKLIKAVIKTNPRFHTSW